MGIAYGLELSGAGLGEGLLELDGERFPPVAVEHRAGPMPSGSQELDADHARLSLLDGLRWVTIDRSEARAIYWGSPLTPDELVHPWLWPVASVFGRWHGREAFHGGAILIRGSAWALLGAKEAGKSTLLAAHAARGGAVVSDDLVVTDGARVFTGPRCVDLRAPLPAPLGDRLGTTRARENSRLRVALAPLPPVLQLAGTVFMAWADGLELRSVPARDALARLARWRAWGGLESDPAVMLALAGLPAMELHRPRHWSALEPALDLLASGLRP